jgi:hypothetical protein
MKLCLKILAIAVIAAFTYSLTGCTAPPSFTYSNVGITLSESCSDCAGTIGTGAAVGVTLQFDPAKPWALLVDGGGNQQGGSIVFTATVTNAPSNLTWSLYPTQNLLEPNPNPTCTTTSTPCVPTSSSANPAELTNGWLTGTFVVVSGNTALFQNAVIGGVEPIYTESALAQAESMTYTVTYPQETVSNLGIPSLQTVSQQMTGIPQGSVLLGVSVPNNPDNPSSVTTAYQLMEIYATSPVVYLTPQTPTTPSNLTDSVVTIPRGTSFAFYGGAAGDPPCASASTCGSNPAGMQTLGTPDNTVVWEVGATPSTAIAGGSTTYGTISTTGVYTAPATIPSGTVCVVVASHAKSSVTASAYITID